MSELIFPVEYSIHLFVLLVCSMLIWKYVIETYLYYKMLLSFHLPIWNYVL